jgi:acylphosphatase
VRNRSDGRVEFWLEGNEQPLKAMREKLQKGSPLSRVDHIEWFTPPATAAVGFNILSTV